MDNNLRNYGIRYQKKTDAAFAKRLFFYRPATPTHPEQLYCNEDACSILARYAQSQGIQTDIPPYVSSLCLKWSETLQNHLGQAPSSGSVNGGPGTRQIADRLRLSENTIKGYMKLLMRKLGVNNRAGIVAALLVEK